MSVYGKAFLNAHTYILIAEFILDYKNTFMLHFKAVYSLKSRLFGNYVTALNPRAQYSIGIKPYFLPKNIWIISQKIFKLVHDLLVLTYDIV